MRQVKAKYVVGLTATPERKDGHHPIIYMQCGPIRFKLSARSMTAATPFEHEVVPRLTDFSLPPEQTDITIQEVYAALVDDRVRNELILTDLVQAAADGRSPLLLTGRTEHLKYFDTELAGKFKNVFTLKGGMGKKQRRSIAEAWIRSFWRCLFRGGELYSNTWGVSTDFMTRSVLCGSTTMLILMSRCWRGCTRAA
jgi:hypothetical protein